MEKLLLKNGNIYDGKLNSDLLMNYDILIEDGIITSISQNITNKDAKIIDLKGSYVIPGLINLHVHLPASGKPSKKKVGDLKKLVAFISKYEITRKVGIKICQKNAEKDLLSGVTTIRTVGGIDDFDARLRDLIKKNKYLGPRIIASNYAIGVVNGHMDGTVAKPARNNEEAIKMVEECKSQGADLIKLMITGGILDTKEKGVIGLLKMNPSMIKACTTKAHELGLKVVAHIEGSEGVKEGILNGVDTIEHGAKVSDELVDLFKNHGGAYVATFSPAIPLAMLDPKPLGYDDIVKYNTQVLLNGMIEFSEKCLKKGIQVGLGTDTGCPLVTHYDMWRELVYFTKCIKGISNKFALHTATLVNANIAGVSDITGSIEVNKSGDLLIVKENPLNDLSSLRNPQYVVFKGKVIKKKVKKYSRVEKVLDKALENL